MGTEVWIQGMICVKSNRLFVLAMAITVCNNGDIRNHKERGFLSKCHRKSKKDTKWVRQQAQLLCPGWQIFDNCS